MPKLVLNRSLVHHSVYGHSLRIEKDVPFEAPNVMVHELLAMGAMPADGKPLIHEPPVVPADPTDPIERREHIFKAFQTVAGRNERDDYAATGLPRAEVISELVGFKVTNKEITAAWVARKGG